MLEESTAGAQHDILRSEPPVELLPIWQTFCLLNATRNGRDRISYAELLAFITLHRAEFSPRDIEAFSMLDSAFISFLQNPQSNQVTASPENLKAFMRAKIEKTTKAGL